MNIHEKFENIVRQRSQEIESWFKDKSLNTPPLVYCSVDIRDSGSKIVPVDTNIFPAGFNNISKNNYLSVAEKFDKYLNQYSNNNKVLIVTENHTRNQKYLENVEALEALIQKRGREVMACRIDDLSINNSLDADIILLNSDLTLGVPEPLGAFNKIIIPDVKFGWYRRLKSRHFAMYERVVEEFCSKFDIDPFFISSLSVEGGEADFKRSQGLDAIAKKVDEAISILRERYKNHEIKDEPYVYIKAEKGTYGMGIMTARSGEEVYSMNKDIRKKMHVIKDGLINAQVVIQEGIRTDVVHNGSAAEIMAYLVGGEPVEFFLRINKYRDAFSSLNKTGAEFVPAGDVSTSYNIVARLAALAAASE